MLSASFPVRRSGPPRVRREFAEFRRRDSFPPWSGEM